MTVYKSTKTYDGFFEQPETKRPYTLFRDDIRAKLLFEFLQERIDMLLSSIISHGRPALQGVLAELEEMLTQHPKFRWTLEDKRVPGDPKKVRHMITMIGAMVKYLVDEHGFVVDTRSVKLKHQQQPGLIASASTYTRAVGAKRGGGK